MSKLTEYVYNRAFGMVRLGPDFPVCGGAGYYKKSDVDAVLQDAKADMQREIHNVEKHYRGQLNNQRMSYEVVMERHDHLVQLLAKRIELHPGRVVLVVTDGD